LSAFFSRFFSNLNHLSDDTLCKLINDELGSVRKVGAKAHLANCWQCRVRHERLEKAAHQVVEYRQYEVLRRPRQDPKRRQSFLTELDRLMVQAQLAPWWSRLFPTFRRNVVAKMTSLLASILVVGVATATLIFIWQRGIPPVSAADLLQRAERADSGSVSASGLGVVYQKIRITTARRTVDRELYRDAEGRRRPKSHPVATDMSPVKSELEAAGINWNEPLSARSYQNWHARQDLKRDQVKRSGKNLLTLTTRTTDRAIAEESLTVREDDFHPVKRTVELRDEGTVEIAEVNYALLDWSGVNEALFEPLTPILPLAVAPAAPPTIAPARPALQTPMQLDDAELQARLVLNHLKADTGEQIRVGRSDTKVVVKGVVDTNQRKRQILDGLGPVPNVTPSILSVEELSAGPIRESATASTKVYSVGGQASPLWEYMREKNLSPDDLSRVSGRLLDACLQLQQSTTALSDLLNLFASPELLSPTSRSARIELMTNYLRDIDSGIAGQEAQLQELGFQRKPGTESAGRPEPGGRADVEDLAAEVQKNRASCRELIAGDEPAQRPASHIASALLDSDAHIHFLVSQLQSKSQSQ
jgi:hypothetical protein